MNERIKQLLGQAYDEAVPETWTTISSEQLGRIYDKFAELIVRECLAQVARVDNMLEDDPAQTAAVAWVASSIADHFGVES